MKKKKIKLPIMKRVAILFFLALLLSVLFSIALNRNYMKDYAVFQVGEIAGGVAAGARSYMGTEEGYYRLLEDEELRKETHDAFREICSKTDVKYLYLYTIDDDGNKHYIVIAGNSDADDIKVNRELGFGRPVKRRIYDCEKEVLNKGVEEACEFVNNSYGDVCQYVLSAFESDEIDALIGVDYPVDSIMDFVIQNELMLIIQSVILIGLAYIITLVLVRSVFIKPIVMLSGKMKNFVNDRTAGNPGKKSERRVSDEISDMEDSFDKMALDISDYVDNIKKLSAESAEVRTQLDIARKLQCGVIPMESALKGDGYEISGIERPAREIGGDFYDIFSIDRENICIAAGDVSGKGLAAALFMFMIRTAIQEKVRAGASLADTLNRVNQDLYLRNPENMFVTVFLMSMNTRTGEVRFANAGHNPPVLLTDSPSMLEMNPGIPLGIFEDADIKEEKMMFKDVEGVMIYTDGITEAVNPEKEQYGEKRLQEAVSESFRKNGDSYDPHALVRDITGSVKSFSGGQDQFDDITCCAVIHNELKADTHPKLESFKDVKDILIYSFGNNERTRKWILACDEIYTNIVDYSGADSVSYRFERRENTCTVTFTDNGVYFDPKKTPVGTREFEELDKGGMGLLFAGKIAKEIVYNRADDMNVLTLRFAI